MRTDTLVLLICTLLTAGYTAFRDIRTGLVNSRILYGMTAVCFFIQAFSIIFQKQQLSVYFMNLLAVTVISLFFYALGICAAGDSKLMLFLASAYPNELYIYTDLNIFPFLYLIVLAFSLLYAFIVAEACWMFFRERDYFIASFKAFYKEHEFLRPLEYGTVLLGVSAVFSVLRTWEINISIYIAFLLYYVIYYLFSKSGRTLRKMILAVSLGAIVMAVKFGSFSVWTIINHYLIVYAFKLLQILLHIANYKIIPAERTAARMVLASITAELLSRQYGLSFLKTKGKENMKARLTESEAEQVRECGIDNVKIVRKAPFTVFLFISLLAYAAIGGFLYYGWHN